MGVQSVTNLLAGKEIEDGSMLSSTYAWSLPDSLTSRCMRSERGNWTFVVGPPMMMLMASTPWGESSAWRPTVRAPASLYLHVGFFVKILT